MKRQQGFTLIELVIVIAVLGILAGIAIPRFLDSRASASGAKLLGDLRTIDSASIIYEARNGEKPTTIDQLVGAGGTSALLAAVPVPPSGDMLVTQNSGAQRRFTYQATAYAITDGRATYTSGEGADKTVEWYLTEAASTGDTGTGTDTGDTGDSGTGTGTVSVAASLTTSSWESFLAKAVLNGWGANTGTAIYKDLKGGLYLLSDDQKVEGTVARANPTLAEYAAAYPSNAFKVDTTKIFTSADKINGGTVWSAENTPQSGSVYYDGTNYYVCIRMPNANSFTNPATDTGGWFKAN